MRKRFLGYGVAVLGAVTFTLFVGWWRVDGPGATRPEPLLPSALTAMEFELIDHDGDAVGPDTLIGRPSMVFFGFTYCPDICPTTLSDISGWLDALGEDAKDLDTIFITVDPERDTIEAMAEYVGHFDPSIRGWTGSLDEIMRAAEGFRVKFVKVATEGGDYTMNHTASVFLYDASGSFAGTIDYHEPEEFAVPKLRRLMANAAAEAA
jgi:protein SCO1/2